jgi:hypothetical protein
MAHVEHGPLFIYLTLSITHPSTWTYYEPMNEKIERQFLPIVEHNKGNLSYHHNTKNNTPLFETCASKPKLVITAHYFCSFFLLIV